MRLSKAVKRMWRSAGGGVSLRVWARRASAYWQEGDAYALREARLDVVHGRPGNTPCASKVMVWATDRKRL